LKAFVHCFIEIANKKTRKKIAQQFSKSFAERTNTLKKWSRPAKLQQQIYKTSG
jgi:hypothetical protein